MFGADLRGGSDSLVGPGGWHPDIRDYDVRPLRLDRRHQAVQVGRHRRQFELWLGLDQLAHPLAQQVVVVGEDDANWHGEQDSARRAGFPVKGGASILLLPSPTCDPFDGDTAA